MKKLLRVIIALLTGIFLLVSVVSCKEPNDDDTVRTDTFIARDGRLVGLTDYGKTLTDIVVPSEIGGMKIVTIGEGSSVFEKCTNLKSVHIPEGVTMICSEAFENCTLLTTVSLPNSLNEVGGWSRSSVFYKCNNLSYNEYNGAKYLGNAENKYVYLAGTVSKDVKEITVADTCKVIGQEAFEECASLSKITLPFRLTCIGSWAFLKCTALTKITIPDGVTSIRDGTFFQCSALKSAVVGNGVTAIGDRAFYECTSLTEVVLGDGVRTIYSEAFLCCSSLEKINIPAGIHEIADDAFFGCNKLPSKPKVN